MHPRLLIGIATAIVALAALYFLSQSGDPTPKPNPETPTQSDAGPSSATKAATLRDAGTNAPADPSSAPQSPDASPQAALDALSPDATAAPSPNPTQSPDADLDTTIANNPTDAQSAAPTDAATADKPSGTLTRDAIKGVISDMRPHVKKCYEDLLKDFPDADGRVVLKFAISADHKGIGRVDLEKVAEDSDLYDKSLNECMIENLRNLEFPAPEGGGEVSVTYPFKFLSAPQPDAGHTP